MATARTILIADELDGILGGSSSALIMLSMTTCPPCRVLKPIFFEISGMPEFGDIQFLHTYMDNTPEVNNFFSTGSVPTLVFIKNGKEVHRTLGLLDRDRLLSKIREHLL